MRQQPIAEGSGGGIGTAAQKGFGVPIGAGKAHGEGQSHGKRNEPAEAETQDTDDWNVSSEGHAGAFMGAGKMSDRIKSLNS